MMGHKREPRAASRAMQHHASKPENVGSRSAIRPRPASLGGVQVH